MDKTKTMIVIGIVSVVAIVAGYQTVILYQKQQFEETTKNLCSDLKSKIQGGVSASEYPALVIREYNIQCGKITGGL